MPLNAGQIAGITGGWRKRGLRHRGVSSWDVPGGFQFPGGNVDFPGGGPGYAGPNIGNWPGGIQPGGNLNAGSPFGNIIPTTIGNTGYPRAILNLIGGMNFGTGPNLSGFMGTSSPGYQGPGSQVYFNPQQGFFRRPWLAQGPLPTYASQGI